MRHKLLSPLNYFLFLLILHSSTLLFAQNNNSNPNTNTTDITLSGYVKDVQSGETLIGAYVYDQQQKSWGTSTNEYGYYSLTLPKGEHTIESSFIGYQTQEWQLDLSKDTVVNFNLAPDGVMLDAIVEVTAKRKDQNVESTDMGVVELSTEQIKSIPALMGEVDVIRSVQLLPGVLSSGEVNAGLYVRGGGPDQNLVLLDEAVVYNIGHLFGFFSVFNSDAIKSTVLHKGSMPAEYGGRLSSVLDISMKDGNNQKVEVEGGIGLISSRFTIQGPIQKNKSSFLIAARRTYADILAQPFLKAQDLDGNGYFFYDLNTKFNYQFSDKDRVYLSGYFGRDVFDYESSDGLKIHMPWGNATTTLRWNHVFTPKLFMNLSAIYNSYNFEVESQFNEFDSRLVSGVRDWNGKLDFDYFLNVNHTIKFGANYTYHTFTPYTVDAVVGDTEINSDSLSKKHAHEVAVYVQDEMALGDRLKINIGLRASGYRQVGPFNELIFNDNGLVTDTVFYDKGEAIADYWGLEPRLNLRYTINNRSSIKASAVWSNQYIHLVSNATTTLPTDLWVSSSKKVKPQRGLQFSLGYFQNFLDNEYEASAEVYYKHLDNQVEYAETYTPELGQDVENQFVYGTGRSYGLELFLKKRRGRFNGWIGYTLSRTTRQFPDINDGLRFPAKYDRTHDLSVVATYELSKRWQLSGTFVYGTGQALTLPNSFFVINGWLFQEFDMPRNSYRLKPYHRLDVSAAWSLNKKPNPKLKNELVFSIYNTYSRLNPFFVYAFPEANENNAGAIDVKLKQVSIFPIVPSITWNFKF